RPVTTSLSGNGTAGFVSTGSLVTGRYQHTATVLNTGKVLITGGESALPVLLTPLASAELYDPDAGTFTPTGSMEASRRHHTATLLNNGTVLIVGGQFSAQASEELCDPAIVAFTSTGRMTTFRLLHTATLLNNGKVLIT